MSLNFRQILPFFILINLVIFSANAQNQVSERVKLDHQLPFIDSSIQVDASLDEAVWQHALKIELKYETMPRENIAPPVKTEVFLFENGQKLFVAFKAYDDDPTAIKNFLTDRDNIWDTDFVGIKFDTFGEARKAFQFFTNAAGVQADAIQEDFKGDNSNWDAVWSSSGQVTKDGYIVEMAIPFKTLRFPESDNKQAWAVELLRFYPREHRHRIANTPFNRDISCKICQFDNLVGFADAKPSQNLSLIPTLVIGRIDNKTPPSKQWNNGEFDEELGLNFRWGITQDLYLNATVNPDFSQVEADSPQLDINNPFSIFVEEKRPFFLDGGDYFETRNQLVNTRNIIAPGYGVKVSGQTNGHSFGIMTVDDDHTSILLPKSISSNLTMLNNSASDNQILRYSYDLGNKNNIGILHTNRSAKDYSNKVTAIDGKYWLDQYHSIGAQYMSSKSQNPNDLINEHGLRKNQKGDALTVNIQHDSRNWWGYFDYIEYDKDFRADLGFIDRVDYDKTVAGLGHRWYSANKNSWWNEVTLGGDWDHTFDNQGNKLEEETELNLEIFGSYQSALIVGIGKRNRFWGDKYFDENFHSIELSSQPFSGIKALLGFNWGDQVDFVNSQLGKEFKINPEITWQITQNWLTKFDYEHIKFDVPNGNLFTARLSNFRLTYLMSVRSFLRFTMQKTDISTTPQLYQKPVNATLKNLSTQLLYSYKINPQTLFFAGYADDGYQDDNLQNIEKTGRSLFMKFSYAWQL
ncbi:DUF5916 domain-containing protein [Aliikangiella sp. IMCC44359]|uniref:DUF5916 domain-containing protein n=1 Tax=Aliikangiella sp. IMCC44359 TaxID=3459125 RepID=UPI00403A7E5B